MGHFTVTLHKQLAFLRSKRRNQTARLSAGWAQRCAPAVILKKTGVRHQYVTESEFSISQMELQAVARTCCLKLTLWNDAVPDKEIWIISTALETEQTQLILMQLPSPGNDKLPWNGLWGHDQPWHHMPGSLHVIRAISEWVSKADAWLKDLDGSQAIETAHLLSGTRVPVTTGQGRSSFHTENWSRHIWQPREKKGERKKKKLYWKVSLKTFWIWLNHGRLYGILGIIKWGVTIM